MKSLFIFWYHEILAPFALKNFSRNDSDSYSDSSAYYSSPVVIVTVEAELLDHL